MEVCGSMVEVCGSMCGSKCGSMSLCLEFKFNLVQISHRKILDPLSEFKIYYHRSSEFIRTI